MSQVLPELAQTVIFGGGSIGCNLACHLTRPGHRDVVLLGQEQMTSGTTWYAAGLIGAGLLKSEANCETSMRAGAYVRCLGGAIGIGFAMGKTPLTQSVVDGGVRKIDAAGRRYPAKASLRPLFDPDMTRMKDLANICDQASETVKAE